MRHSVCRLLALNEEALAEMGYQQAKQSWSALEEFLG